MKDEWGGIDTRIKGLVQALHAFGVATTGSCEGHSDYGSPAPWIKISHKKYKKKVITLLNFFYKKRAVSLATRFVIEDGRVGFWLHNGGDDYQKWRSMVAHIVLSKKQKKEKRYVLNEQEKIKRAKHLHTYQKELKLFEHFIKKSFLYKKQ